MTDEYKEAKKIRTEQYNKQYGKKLVKCGSCSGSGYYDNNTGSPKCGLCKGTGKTRQL